MNHRIQKFTNDGAFVTTWGTDGSGDGQFSQPAALAVDLDGFAYVADMGQHRVQKFTGSGAFVSAWGGPGSGPAQFNSPTGIATDPEGFMIVTDSGNQRLRRRRVWLAARLCRSCPLPLAPPGHLPL